MLKQFLMSKYALLGTAKQSVYLPANELQTKNRILFHIFTFTCILALVSIIRCMHSARAVLRQIHT